MKHDKPDLDTDTGLPRKVVMKLVWKLAISSLVLLNGMVIYNGRQIIEQQKQTNKEVVQLRIEVARIQVFLKMSPAVAALSKEAVPSP